MPTLTVERVDRLTDDAVAVTFAVPDHLRDTFAFAAGQHLTVCRTVDGVEHRRTYSVCAPAGSAPRIGVREIPNGLLSSWLVRDVRPGDVVEVHPPVGSFHADATTGGRHLCVAAGSGITPVLSIAATLLAAPDAHVTLLYGNRTAASVMFTEELAALKDQHPDRFELVHVLSREPREVELFSGRLDAAKLRSILDALVPVADLDDVWLCGPFGLVQEARRVLDDVGVPAERVHVEHFYVDEPPPELRHADPVVGADASEVTVVLDGRATVVPVERAETVLDAAQRARSDLPFACKGGVCGTCRARVVEGEVAMRRNYALEEHEVEAGFVLTCQSVPLSGAVTVDFDA